MNGKKKYCIAIPAYKEKLSVDEEISLQKLSTTLKDKSNVYLFCPHDLDITEYRKYIPEIKTKCFDKDNFISIRAYSNLCMKYELYDAFSEYEFMLIFQLDCYLVRDEIEEWCNKGYDYVGAPIVAPHSDWNNFRINADGITVVTPVVGNGGFSLRKVETFKFITDPNGEFKKRYDMSKIENECKYEDVYFCVLISKLYELEKPKWSEALSFAFDMNPDKIETHYGVKALPMCIHAFDKNIPYWRTRIKDLDRKDVYECCFNKHKDFITQYYVKLNDKQNLS